MKCGPILLAVLLAACGPQIGNLHKGETGRVVRAFNGDTVVLDSGLVVFLAEIDAPRGDEQYASQSEGELEALALHRNVLLAYGGDRRWHSEIRPGGAARDDAAIAHVFVQSEGGRWFWLQHELVSRGAAFVRPRTGNIARTPQLMAIEAHARATQTGLWGRRPYQSLEVRGIARAALATHKACTDRAAPYRLVEGVVTEARVSDGRASLAMEGGSAAHPFAVVVFGDGFAHWDGPSLETLTGARIRARGPLGVLDDEAQLCLENGLDLDVLPNGPERTSSPPSSSTRAPASAPAASTE